MKVVQRLLALVGASGSGKTTTLRIAAGYESPDSGTVTLGGVDITGVPPERRGFGMVFQHYALFPHMPVEDNVAFGLEARGVGKSDRLTQARVARRMLVGSRGWCRFISVGGAAARVALARGGDKPRASPDEALSNLDPTLRQARRDDRRRCAGVGVPARSARMTRRMISR